MKETESKVFNTMVSLLFNVIGIGLAAIVLPIWLVVESALHLWDKCKVNGK